ncbi:transcription factor bHLH143-like [Rhodamnia argentea]|uniref:Transcription factor bHLH143-like n=1 Tax=Rhodamnia argentea TaxID=178133 RepID=A0A8B8P3T7_9MYRT|nr:transcription factor bHLH143-like [Rhodamnia argentea]
MEEDGGFPQQHSAWQLPKSDLPNFQFNLGYPGLISAQKSGGQKMVPSDQVLPLDVFSGLPHPRISQSYEPQGWFYCLPRFRQASAPPSDNLVLEDKLPATTFEKWRDFSMPNAGSISLQKKFVVFDRSGDQTTLIYSTGKGVPTECLPTWTTKHLFPRSAVNNVAGSNNADHDNHFGPPLMERIHENPETDVQSEMREDTEELNALLYSDDDTDYSDGDDDEVTSTGHSPSTMTDHERRGLSEESNEEVASSIWPFKRQRTSCGDDQLPSLMDTAKSYLRESIGSEDDAKSSSADGKKYAHDLVSISGDKKIKRERIRETVNVLQSIVPSGKGKNAIVILDEAINYLKSLKRKAEALGLTP